MQSSKAHIIQQLQREILPLQGCKQPGLTKHQVVIPIMEEAFPFSRFPLGAVHEFISMGGKDLAATSGFIFSVLGQLMQQGGACIWIGSSQAIYPMALQAFNVPADRIIFINTSKQNDMLWIMEEALKCDAILAVIAEIKDISFAISRRLQLATEKTQVTAFLVRDQCKKINNIAAVARWQIKALPSELEVGMPGVGFPKWNVALQKVRNGKPGEWQLEWTAAGYRLVEEEMLAIPIRPMVKTA